MCLSSPLHVTWCGWVSICPLILAANPAAGPVFTDAPDTPATPMGQSIAGNVLGNANVPPGQTASVTGFTVAGSSQVYTPGSGPVTLYSPTTGKAIGALTVASNGDYAFDPVDGYMGPAPAINLYSKTSGGQTAVSGLTIDVVARECACRVCA